jgi:hypothetical protein
MSLRTLFVTLVFDSVGTVLPHMNWSPELMCHAGKPITCTNVLMDNIPFHHSKEIVAIAAMHGVRILYILHDRDGVFVVETQVPYSTL